MNVAFAWRRALVSFVAPLSVVVACGARSSLDIDVPDVPVPAADASRVDVKLPEAGPDRDAPSDARDVLALDARPNGPPCVSDRDCNDGIACTLDECVDQHCRVTAKDELCPVSAACEPLVGCEQRAWVVGNGLFDIRLPSGRIAARHAGVGGFDIALSPQGRLIVGSFVLDEVVAVDGRYETRPLGGASGDLGGLIALDYAPNGRLYAGSYERIVRVDVDGANLEDVARYPDGYQASGDIAFVGGRLLTTAFGHGDVDDVLVEVDVAGGTSRVLGHVGYSCVYGLAAFGAELYGFTCYGDILRIDANDAHATLVAQTGEGFDGATAR